MPGIVAVALAFFSRWRLVCSLVAVFIAGILFVLGLVISPGSEYSIGPLTLSISDTLRVLGRETIIGPANLPEVLIIYGGAALWIAGGYFSRASKLFPAIALAMAALQTAAITIQPFLYAAVFIELLAILTVPLTAEAGKKIQQGILRLIIFYTLGMAAILFVGWMLTGPTTGATGNSLLLNAVILLAVGFVFFLAIFPAHSWVPMLMEMGNPFTSAFIIFWLTQAALLFSDGLIDQYNLVAANIFGSQVLATIGMLIILIFGIMIVFQNHLGRILGFAILMETGFAILAISLEPYTSKSLFYALQIQKSLPVMLWALALHFFLRQRADLDFSKARGAGVGQPWTSAMLLLAYLSILGLPFLPLFTPKAVLFETLALEFGWLLPGIAVGVLGLLVVLLRTVSILFDGREAVTANRLRGEMLSDPGRRETVKPQLSDPRAQVQIDESRRIKFLMLIGLLLLFGVGLISGFFLPPYL
jgi:formate hydrogenlyase subunit 3/multisubunit Na+/H+ antiporter MnhD subunit